MCSVWFVATILSYHFQECNQFLAEHALWSSGRYKALDETGLVGIVCRHEVPHKVFSLKHGDGTSTLFNLMWHDTTSCL